MVDFTLTDEQKDLRELAHSFAEKDMRSVAWELDKDGGWPEDVIKKATRPTRVAGLALRAVKAR